MDELKKLLKRFSPFSSIVDFFLKRAKLVENTLKEKYSTVLRVGFCLLLSFFW
jgi:hypothetical protein